jgi:hypothetical protein
MGTIEAQSEAREALLHPVTHVTDSDLSVNHHLRWCCIRTDQITRLVRFGALGTETDQTAIYFFGTVREVYRLNIGITV